VVDEQGEPIAASRVCATCASCDATQTDLQTCAETNSQGEFALYELKPISYRVVAAAQGFALGVANDGAPLWGGDDHALRIVLGKRGVEVSGTVLDAFGGPIAGASVRVVQWAGTAAALEATSRDDGQFSIWTGAGATTLIASAEGYAPSTRQRVAPARGVELVLTPAASLSGTVLSAEDGSPIADAEVRALRLDRPPLAAQKAVRSQEDGQFTIADLEQAEYFVEAIGQNYRGRSEGAIAVGVGGHVTGITVRVSRAVQVSGRVIVGSTGQACAEGTITLGPPQRSPFSKATFSDETKAAISALERPGSLRPIMISAAIVADGAVRFDGVPAGHYFATVQCAGYQLREGPELLAVGLTDISGLTWRVEPGLALAVEVIDQQGRPLPGAPFMLAFPASEAGGPRPVMPLTADSEGRYETPRSLFPGAYRVQPAGNSAGDAVEVTLAESTPTTKVTLRLHGNAALLVQVQGSDGAPIDGAEVQATPERGADAGAQITEHLLATPLGAGTYRVAPLPAGSYSVEVSDGINPSVTAQGGTPLQVAVGSTTQVTVVLPQGAEIRGTVRDERGGPIENVWVSAEREGDDIRSRYTTAMKRMEGEGRTLSDPEGHFTLRRLTPDATFTVRAEESGGGLERVRGIRAGAQVALVLRAPATVRGVATDAQGAAAAMFAVSAVQLENGERRERQFKGTEGRFELAGLAPGTVELTASDPYRNIGQARLSLRPGQTLEGIHVTLQPLAATPPAAE
jgi:protocatechuate 3,4-dioxygenase beta subunit